MGQHADDSCQTRNASTTTEPHDPLVCILSTPCAIAWPAGDGKVPSKAQHLRLSAALTRAFTTDAHVQLTSISSVPHRLRKDALARVGDGVPIVVLLVDVDAHELPADQLSA